MTTFREVQLTCAVCGHTAAHTVLVSSSAFGDVDLDTRPPPLLRLALPLQIQSCPLCGYCAEDIAVAPPEAKKIVRGAEYRKQLKDERFPYLANLFLCHALLRAACGDYPGAGWAAIRAAWACDDAGPAYAQAAVACRMRAVAWLSQARQQGQPFATGPGAEEALLADLLRRSGRFDAALMEIRRGLASQPSRELRDVLRFEEHLCRRRDAGVHTMGEAFRHAGRDDL